MILAEVLMVKPSLAWPNCFFLVFWHGTIPKKKGKKWFGPTRLGDGRVQALVVGLGLASDTYHTNYFTVHT